MANDDKEKRTVFSTKQVVIAACIIGFFIYMTFSDDPSSSTDTYTAPTASTQQGSSSSSADQSVLNDLNHMLADEPQKESLLDDAHIVKQPADTIDPFVELDNLVGLESVKEEVHSLANYIKLIKEREKNGLKSPKVTYHCVFSGNPGTGKTTVARILGRIYKQLGVVSKGQLVETDRSGLIGQYTGHTAPKTNAIIDQALGGVLFIDEAYALTQGKDDGYGQEAIATLLKRMEDDRDNLVVIVAGYTDEMKQFIDANPGLQSRFTRYINFPDYTADELYSIFLTRLKPYSLILSTDAERKLHEILESAVKHKSRNFGNARYVRNLFETAYTHMADRLSQTKKHTRLELCTLMAEDIQFAYERVKS